MGSMLKLHEIGDNMSQLRELDQFFTEKNTVSTCLLILERHLNKNNIEWIEPSAGAGSFIDGAYEMGFGYPKVAFDIMPQHKMVQKGDFLKENLDEIFSENNKIKLFLGNPPFGKNSSLAIKFFNHMSKSNADVIAMILPATFSKNSIKNKLDLNFVLAEELNLGSVEFLFGIEKRKVPVVFQIWKRSNIKREKIIERTTSIFFDFVNKEEGDFAIQRVGAAAGKVKVDFKEVSPNSHYFIKVKYGNVLDVFNKINWDKVKYRTAGNPSIAKTELIKEFEISFSYEKN